MENGFINNETVRVFRRSMATDQDFVDLHIWIKSGLKALDSSFRSENIIKIP